jgi:hypothetical protein
MNIIMAIFPNHLHKLGYKLYNYGYIVEMHPLAYPSGLLRKSTGTHWFVHKKVVFHHFPQDIKERRSEEHHSKETQRSSTDNLL